MTNGMGFIAVALVYFGSWRPRGVLVGSLIFSFVNALQLWIQVKGIEIPSDLAIMMPYVLTIAGSRVCGSPRIAAGCANQSIHAR